MKKLLLTLLVVLISQNAYALDVVYPKTKEATVYANSTFFIGSSDVKKPLTINGEKINIHESGGFAHLVPLNTGKNTFTLRSGNETLMYTITKPDFKISHINSESKFNEFDTIRFAEVIKENSPLRSTPVDAGINRIAHLQKDMPLSIDGEQDGFYRVILGSSRFGWIAKNNIRLSGSGSSLANLKGYDYVDTKEFFIFVFHLDKMTPFELEEGEPFNIRLFNVAEQPQNTYVMDFPIHEALGGKRLLGYSARFSGTDFIVKIRKPILTDRQKPLKNIKITVDAGHGGKELGAVGCLGDFEKNLNLSFARLLEQELKRRGANVSMTRIFDYDVDLQKRVEITNDENSVIFISLHGNAIPDGKDPNTSFGTEVYYYYPQAKTLAESVLTQITSQTGMRNNKTHQQSFAVVRNTNALSILVEIGYVINPSDNAKMRDKEFQKQTAKAIADGVENFFRN